MNYKFNVRKPNPTINQPQINQPQINQPQISINNIDDLIELVQPINQPQISVDFLQLKNNESILSDENKLKKILVLYVFHEYNNRVEHFLKYCVFNDKNVHFIIISNNINFKLHRLPENVSFLARDNIGYDFGGWSDALLTNNLYKNYDYFIFVNSSVIGPFMNNNQKWTDIYINGLQKDNIKLFGSTINAMGVNCNIAAHVQSYIYSMNIITLEYLIKCNIFTMESYVTSFNDAIDLKEILMSRKIIENNWNIGSLMHNYKNVDFTFKNKKVNDYDNIFIYDILNDESYKKRLFSVYELVFIKGNRGISIII